MRHHLTGLVAALALAAVAAPAIAADKVQTITASDKTFAFAPSTVTLQAGKPNKLKFVTASGAHGIAQSDIGLNVAAITPGPGTEVTVTPKKKGTYTAHCTLVCGAGHANMAMKFIVK